MLRNTGVTSRWHRRQNYGEKHRCHVTLTPSAELWWETPVWRHADTVGRIMVPSEPPTGSRNFLCDHQTQQRGDIHVPTSLTPAGHVSFWICIVTIQRQTSLCGVKIEATPRTSKFVIQKQMHAARHVKSLVLQQGSASIHTQRTRNNDQPPTPQICVQSHRSADRSYNLSSSVRPWTHEVKNWDSITCIIFLSTVHCPLSTVHCACRCKSYPASNLIGTEGRGTLYEAGKGPEREAEHSHPIVCPGGKCVELPVTFPYAWIQLRFTEHKGNFTLRSMSASVDGRIILKQIFKKQQGGTDWMDIPQDRNMAALVLAAMNFCVLQNSGHFWLAAELRASQSKLCAMASVCQWTRQSVSQSISRSASYPVSQSVG